MAFAGLWESFRWSDETVIRTFTIITTTPNAEMLELHDRMPVILDQQDWPTWLGEAEGDCGRHGQHDPPHRSAAGALNAGEQLCPARTAAAAVADTIPQEP